ncbi:hypothetical protein N7513_006132 [Penicillium frequentans]|uniref:Rhodopsin domain-containing protein n=1 Tax=Penicillium frequentans TaxID=3151616 RepID=A0AAD6GEZ0_9EURO|nr:hypothetical protein N7494_007660 [Penicillium glabrum]KAJ5548898.1 hypothetical protein N7513_006132 [Penicillium glabrum]
MVDYHHQNTALGVVVAFPILGGIAVLLRLWARSLSRSALSSDDYFIVAGYILAISQSVTSWYYIKTNYVGIHEWDIPKDYDVKQGLIWNYANQLLYNPCLTLIKVSILMFLRRLESRSRVVNILIWTSLGVIASLFIAVLFVDIFQCHPITYNWDLTIKGGKCIDQGAFYVSTAALNLFTDLMVISIPIIITWHLQMPLRRKIAVCLILCLGGVATAIGVWRIIILAKAFFPTGPVEDSTFGIGFCSSAVEVNVAVITACAPSMKAITSKYLPRLLGTSRNGKSSYGPGTSGGSRGFRKSRFFPSSRKSSQLRSGTDGDTAYEMADPSRGNRVDVVGAGKGSFDMRKYRRGGDSPSISSGSVELEGPAGIIKTTDVSVQYTNGSEDGRSRAEKSVSMDSLV